MEFMTIEQLGELLYLRWCEHTNPGKPVNVTWALLTEDQRRFWTDCVFIVSEHTQRYALQPKSPYPAWRYEEAERVAKSIELDNQHVDKWPLTDNETKTE